MISRRQFLIGFLPAMLPVEQPYPPVGPSAAPDNGPMALSEEAWRMNVVGLIAFHWHLIRHQGTRIKKLEWYTPGLEIYKSEKRDT